MGKNDGLDEGFIKGCMDGRVGDEVGMGVDAVTCTFSIKLEVSPVGASVRKVSSIFWVLAIVLTGKVWLKYFQVGEVRLRMKEVEPSDTCK